MAPTPLSPRRFITGMRSLSLSPPQKCRKNDARITVSGSCWPSARVAALYRIEAFCTSGGTAHTLKMSSERASSKLVFAAKERSGSSKSTRQPAAGKRKPDMDRIAASALPLRGAGGRACARRTARGAPSAAQAAATELRPVICGNRRAAATHALPAPKLRPGGPLIRSRSFQPSFALTF